MDTRRLRSVISLLLCLIIGVTGCGQTIVTSESNTESQTVTQEIKIPILESQITYEMPVSRVNVLVDRNGYQSDRDKQVFFLGKELHDEFLVINADTEEIVYTGRMEKQVYDSQKQIFISYGDFSQLQETGNYYIETAVIGRSYPFQIEDNLYQDLLIKNLQLDDLVNMDNDAANIRDLSLGLHTLLLVLENRGNVFEKDTELISWILKVINWLMTCQNESGSICDDYEATAVYCGALTMCMDSFGKYDAVMEKECKKSIQSAWNWMEHCNTNEMNEDALFYVSAADFHVNHNQKSKESVLKYMTRHQGQLTGHLYGILGSIMYISTEKGTDRDTCTKVMQELVDQTEKICQTVKSYPYGVYSPEISENMRNMLLISFVDYVTPSNEYAVVMEDFIHFLAGRNESGENLIPMGGKWAENEMTQDSSLIWSGILINCLGGLLGDKE